MSFEPSPDPQTRQSPGVSIRVSGTVCLSETLVGDFLAALSGAVASGQPMGLEPQSQIRMVDLDLGPVRLANGRAAVDVKLSATLRKEP